MTHDEATKIAVAFHCTEFRIGAVLTTFIWEGEDDGFAVELQSDANIRDIEVFKEFASTCAAHVYGMDAKHLFFVQAAICLGIDAAQVQRWEREFNLTISAHERLECMIEYKSRLEREGVMI